MGFKVLYIEDNKENLETIRDVFEWTDHEFYSAVDGKTGLEQITAIQPDVILCDIHLPDIDGRELVQKIKLVVRDTPVLALTGDHSREMKHECMLAGFNTVLHKPISRFGLLDAVRQIAEQAAPIPTKLPPTPEENSDKKLKKVLVAEDNADLRTIFSYAFDPNLFDVRVAVDGADALENLKRETPDIVILDINMPQLSGFDVLTYIRNHEYTKHVKVVVVTGNSMASLDPQAEYADLLLVKPVDIFDLRRLAERLIAQP